MYVYIIIYISMDSGSGMLHGRIPSTQEFLSSQFFGDGNIAIFVDQKPVYTQFFHAMN